MMLPESIEVLIADDDPVVRHLLSSVLHAAGFRVIAVESGSQCLALFGQRLAENAIPNVVFLDIQLADMAGTEILIHIRGHAQCKDLPIVMLSAHSKEEVLKQYPEAKQANEILSKPFPFDLAVATVKQLCLAPTR